MKKFISFEFTLFHTNMNIISLLKLKLKDIK